MNSRNMLALLKALISAFMVVELCEYVCLLKLHKFVLTKSRVITCQFSWTAAMFFFEYALVPDVREQIYFYKTCINVALFMKESLFTFHPMTPKAKEVQNSKNRHFD